LDAKESVPNKFRSFASLRMTVRRFQGKRAKCVILSNAKNLSFLIAGLVRF